MAWRVVTVLYWIELSTPKEILFFKQFIPELEARGHKWFVTTREYGETNDLLRHFNIKNTCIGYHAAAREDKLRASINRMGSLQTMVKCADALITLANPEASRVAFGLGMPIFNFIDMPEAEKVCRLSLPLSTLVFAPFHVKKKVIRRYWDGEIFTYNCLDPVAWMPKEPKPLNEILPEGVTWPFIIYREGETQATYYSEGGGQDLTHDIIEELKKRYPEGTFYNVSRYSGHKMVDMQSLLAYADVFIGGGGTMNIEAAWWGTWTITCRPIKTSYDWWMWHYGLQHDVSTVSDGVDMAELFLIVPCKNTAAKCLRRMKFPLKEIVGKMEAILGSKA